MVIAGVVLIVLRRRRRHKTASLPAVVVPVYMNPLFQTGERPASVDAHAPAAVADPSPQWVDYRVARPRQQWGDYRAMDADSVVYAVPLSADPATGAAYGEPLTKPLAAPSSEDAYGHLVNAPAIFLPHTYDRLNRDQTA